VDRGKYGYVCYQYYVENEIVCLSRLLIVSENGLYEKLKLRNGSWIKNQNTISRLATLKVTLIIMQCTMLT